jgi:hypothetical protein
MTATAITPAAYIDSLADDRKYAMGRLREVILKNLPLGFEEIISGGMICYVVPHSIYPNGYHCDPKQPLPFLSIASQKNFIAVYHMGIYANQNLLSWFRDQYAKRMKTKLDMGKSCIRFKKMDAIPFDLLGELVSQVTPQQWITTYETVFRKG